jgi:aryl-alcohol dehydrogenase-like predicted oxidoreductase
MREASREVAVRRTRSIGSVEVSAVALGGMSWSLPSPLDEQSVTQLIHAAIDAGVTVLDTARVYTTADEISHNERLIGSALQGHTRRDDILVATKGGHHRDGRSGFVIDGRPETIRTHVEDSLRLLRCEAIGLYQLHWPDPKIPLVESVGAIALLQQEGKVLRIGLSNVSIPQIIDAQSVAQIVSVQNRLSAFNADDRETVTWTCARGIAYLAYQPLGGASNASTIARQLPAFGAAAANRESSAQSLAIAWLLTMSENVIPIVGASTPRSIVDAVQAMSIQLSDADMHALDQDVVARRRE